MFGSFEVAYYTSFLPLKFVKSTQAIKSEELYIETSAVVASGIFTFAVVFITNLVLFFRRRA